MAELTSPQTVPGAGVVFWMLWASWDVLAELVNRRPWTFVVLIMTSAGLTVGLRIYANYKYGRERERQLGRLGPALMFAARLFGLVAVGVGWFTGSGWMFQTQMF